MFENPKSLENICIDTVCDNILCYVLPDIGKKESNFWWDKNKTPKEELIHLYRFKDPDIFLIKEISEKLLIKLQEKKLLYDNTLHIFNGKNTRLKSVRLKSCGITLIGIQILKEHKITDLECIELKTLSIGDILDSVNEWTLNNILKVNFHSCTFVNGSRHTYMVKITSLKNLRSLNLCNTELNQSVFKMICEDLVHLEFLDVSATRIHDLSPLTMLSETLVSLCIADLARVLNVMDTLDSLKNLRHLDISIHNESEDQPSLHLDKDRMFSKELDFLPELVSLDVSGWKLNLEKENFGSFLASRPKLRFLGLINTGICDKVSVNDTVINLIPKHITVASLLNVDQIKVVLQLYNQKPNNIQKALYNLFVQTNMFDGPRPDILKLVLPVMAYAPSTFGIQMAATACLYNLTRGDLSKHIHPSLLAEAVRLTLISMEQYPKRYQLQKNCLLILCSDRILQEVTFDRFHCARLVLDALCEFDDTNMNRMAVAICGILAAKVSTDETSELGAKPSYMTKLLSMVRTRVETITADITLKFTLSTLWNLTDESSATCEVFLDQGGAVLFLDVLATFEDDGTIETKVLGLLNNIAEVSRLRNKLMLDPLTEKLHSLLKSKNIDVSYFAAGIVAHLASDGEEKWTITSHTRREMLVELEKSVLQWSEPEAEMVAYRSFRPFFSLLKVDMDYQVQLWAVWAILHVCSTNPIRYCSMLREENGHMLLSDLVNYTDTNERIVTLSTEILKTVENHPS